MKPSIIFRLALILFHKEIYGIENTVYKFPNDSIYLMECDSVGQPLDDGLIRCIYVVDKRIAVEHLTTSQFLEYCEIPIITMVLTKR